MGVIEGTPFAMGRYPQGARLGADVLAPRASSCFWCHEFRKIGRLRFDKLVQRWLQHDQPGL